MTNRIFIILIAFFLPISLFGNEIIYVSYNGDDSYKGTRDMPIKSLTKALELGSRRKKYSKKDTLFIKINEGKYYIDKSIIINKVPSRPIVIEGSENNKTEFIGGNIISNWKKEKANLYYCIVPTIYNAEQLFINGNRATLAKTPDTSWFTVVGSSQSEPDKNNITTLSVKLKQKDMLSLKNLSDDEIKNIKVRFYHKWDNTHRWLTGVDMKKNIILTNKEYINPDNMITDGSRCILYNYKNALNQKGEWYFDKAKQRIYYSPREGETIEKSNCIVPQISKLLVLHGTPISPIQNITFKNISFGYAAHFTPERGDGPLQAAYNTEACIELDYTNNISFINCHIIHTGNNGIWLRQECYNNKIQNCTFKDLGIGGIKLGLGNRLQDNRLISSNNIIENNLIDNIGNDQACGVGILILNSKNNTISHNELSNMYYTAISAGWYWGYNKDKKNEFNPSTNNIIEYNLIHDIGKGELSDLAGIYTLGESPGTVIRNNVIYNVFGYQKMAWGIYNDEGSSYITIKNNLVYNCTSGGYHLHYGKHNIVENNIFALGIQHQGEINSVETDSMLSFRHNIIYQNEGPTLTGYWDKAKIDQDYNLYYSTKGNITISNIEWKEWISKHDKHSIISNPFFKNPNKGDFSFVNTNAIKRIGFIPFNAKLSGRYVH